MSSILIHPSTQETDPRADGRTCLACGQTFYHISPKAKYCSDLCKKQHHRAQDQRPRKRSPEITAAWLEDLEWLVDNGASVATVCSAMHAKPAAIAKRLRHNGGSADLAAMFERYA